jgi:ABC-2 type transport system ATP-binding protein
MHIVTAGPADEDEKVETAADTPRDAVEMSTVVVAKSLDTLVDSATDYHPPVTPGDPPSALTSLATARRQSFDTSPTPTNAEETGPTPVVAIPQTAPLKGLQYLPVLGQTVVTPIVTLIHQIPLIGDVLHPFIGYPVQLGLPAGTPTPRDVKVISFDGTKIYVHFFPAAGLPADKPAPTILDGPGLALPGSTNYLSEKDEFLPNDVIGIGALRSAGYNVVTWDPRGEWSSGGQLEVDSPDFEAHDVSAIISWLATQPEVQMDEGNLDPRIGMVGASYGGGIQLAAAAIDDRIDAIVPTIAWHSLTTSLYKNQAFKSSWGTLLTVALLGTLARPNPRLYPAAIIGDLTGLVSRADQDLLKDRGPGDMVDEITAPTLLVQGTVDTLFTLQEAHENAMALIGNHVPTKVVWFCGGHGACVSSTNDGILVVGATLNWLDRWVKGDENAVTGAQFEWVDQHGTRYSSATYPVPCGVPVVASLDTGGVLPLVSVLGGSGPQLGVLGSGPLGALLGLPSGAKAINALNLTTPKSATTNYVVGAPKLTFAYSGIGTSRHVYAQLVDDTTGLVLGNLVTPISVTLDGKSHDVSVDLEQVAQTLRPGETVTLQLVASAVPYETANSIGVLHVPSMTLTLPTAMAPSPV